MAKKADLKLYISDSGNPKHHIRGRSPSLYTDPAQPNTKKPSSVLTTVSKSAQSTESFSHNTPTSQTHRRTHNSRDKLNCYHGRLKMIRYLCNGTIDVCGLILRTAGNGGIIVRQCLHGVYITTPFIIAINLLASQSVSNRYKTK